MAYRVLTISREYGAGGGRVAEIAAERLGWKLLDRSLLEEIAQAAKVDAKVARAFDERAESWLGRINREAMRAAALAAGIAVEHCGAIDCDALADLARAAIDRAYEEGHCVIVGRGAQCVLGHRPDVYRVFVYAPTAERKNRLAARLNGNGRVDLDRAIRESDDVRGRYIRAHFNRDWRDPHLYDLMVCSTDGEDRAAMVALCAMGCDTIPTTS